MDTPGSYKCQCQLGFSGQNCEDVRYIRVQICILLLFSNRRKYKRVVFIDMYNFLCAKVCGVISSENYKELFWQGVNECLSTPCQSGGTCTGGVGFYTCACVDVSLSQKMFVICKNYIIIDWSSEN